MELEDLITPLSVRTGASSDWAAQIISTSLSGTIFNVFWPPKPEASVQTNRLSLSDPTYFSRVPVYQQRTHIIKEWEMKADTDPRCQERLYTVMCCLYLHHHRS
jgi:hypothetical protein